MPLGSCALWPMEAPSAVLTWLRRAASQCWCAKLGEQGFDIELVRLASPEERLSALEEGRVDAMLSGAWVALRRCKLPPEFADALALRCKACALHSGHTCMDCICLLARPCWL